MHASAGQLTRGPDCDGAWEAGIRNLRARTARHERARYTQNAMSYIGLRVVQTILICDSLLKERPVACSRSYRRDCCVQINPLCTHAYAQNVVGALYAWTPFRPRSPLVLAGGNVCTFRQRHHG